MASSRSRDGNEMGRQHQNQQSGGNEDFDNLVRRFVGGTGREGGALMNFGSTTGIDSETQVLSNEQQRNLNEAFFSQGAMADDANHSFGFRFSSSLGSPPGTQTGSESYERHADMVHRNRGEYSSANSDTYSSTSAQHHHSQHYTPWYESLPVGRIPVPVTGNGYGPAFGGEQHAEFDSLDVEAFLYDEIANPSNRGISHSGRDSIPFSSSGPSNLGQFGGVRYSSSTDCRGSQYGNPQISSASSDHRGISALSQSFPQPVTSPGFANRSMTQTNIGYPNGGASASYHSQMHTSQQQQHMYDQSIRYDSRPGFQTNQQHNQYPMSTWSQHSPRAGNGNFIGQYPMQNSGSERYLETYQGVHPRGLSYQEDQSISMAQQVPAHGQPYQQFYPAAAPSRNSINPSRTMDHVTYSTQLDPRYSNATLQASDSRINRQPTQQNIAPASKSQRNTKQHQSQRPKLPVKVTDATLVGQQNRTQDSNKTRISRSGHTKSAKGRSQGGEATSSGRSGSRVPSSKSSHDDSGSTEQLAGTSSNSPRKRNEVLAETASTKVKFKEFQKVFRMRDKEGFEHAFQYAKEALSTLPEEIHWRVYLDMADLCKRENKFSLARKLYRKVNMLQPYAPQGWLEYSKMEEECGELPHCQEILHQGLHYCSFSESLLTKAIKHEERMGNLQGARSLLARLRTQSIDKAWKTVLEGALLEARAGHQVIARKVFKYLMKNVPWYGPIYHEAARFEERNEEYDRAITNVERGLANAPRYGPLWFTAFRLIETKETSDAEKIALTNNDMENLEPVKYWNDNVEIDLKNKFGMEGNELGYRIKKCQLSATSAVLERAYGSISKELVWKVHFEAAQASERGGDEGWLESARQSYVQSVLRCPLNLRWKVWLAGARTELAAGNIDIARQLLVRALDKVPEKSRSQVLLECSRLEEYTGNLDDARAVLANARKDTKHEWKVFLESVMLEVRAGNRAVAIAQAEDALRIHSGTGRLWAIVVQLKHVQGPTVQRQVFRDALKEVPKSGEVWCEGARVCLHPLSPHFDLDTAERFLQFAIQFTPQYGDSFIEALRLRLMVCDTEDTPTAEQARHAMWAVDTSGLEQRCVNADPNYGALWFHCKRGPFNTARQVLRVAKRLLIAELIHFRNVLRSARGLSIPECKNEVLSKDCFTRNIDVKDCADDPSHWVKERVALLPSANKNCFDFSTGLVHVNWFRERMKDLVPKEQRKILFDSDQIVP